MRDSLYNHPHTVDWRGPHGHRSLAIIGCGGTGSLLAETLCRLLIGTPTTITLIDPDIIEPHNLLRQNFLETELGQPKSRALAQRLSQQFSRPIGYSQNDCRDLLPPEEPSPWDLTICCVDNALARAAVHATTHLASWILDTGNGREQGQVLLGNLSLTGHNAWQQGDPGPYFYDNRCFALPAPATQQPELLVPQQDEAHNDRDCAQAVLLQDQSPLINQAIALAAAQFVYKLLTGRCRYMAVYLDLARGSTTTVPATPAHTARAFHISDPEYLME